MNIICSWMNKNESSLRKAETLVLKARKGHNSYDYQCSRCRMDLLCQPCRTSYGRAGKSRKQCSGVERMRYDTIDIAAEFLVITGRCHYYDHAHDTRRSSKYYQRIARKISKVSSYCMSRGWLEVHLVELLSNFLFLFP